MPFEILNTEIGTDVLPSDLLLAPAPFLGDNVHVAPEPTSDAMGGTIRVIGAARSEDGQSQTINLEYTDLDGIVTTGSIDAEIVSNPNFGLIAPVVVGDELTEFLLVSFVLDVADDGSENFYFEPLVVGFDGTEFSLIKGGGDPDSGNPEDLSFLGSGLTGGNQVFADTYALGDGRVGVVVSDSGQGFDGEPDEYFQSGVFIEEDGEYRFEWLDDDSSDVQHLLATDDGGLVRITAVSGGEGPVQYEITQFGADYENVGSHTLDVSASLLAAGLTVDNSQLVFLINDAGELDVVMMPPEGVEGDSLRVELDLLPLAEEPVIEPPLPPVDENTPTAGDDVLLGTSGDDVIDALGGNDVVRGLGGKDWIIGGEGDDSIDGGRGDDALIAGEPVEPVEGEEPADALPAQGGLYGGAGADSINGRQGTDYIDGGDGDDDLRGGDGGDSSRALNAQGEGGIYGGEGDDFIRGNHGSDDLFGGAGNDDMNGGFGDDFVIGGAGDDKLAGYDGMDIVYGGDGNDVISGGRGNDELDGDAGDDTLRGGGGEDALHGGEGDDLLIGGEGKDSFNYYLFEGSENGTDTIKDFGSGDVISFTSEEGETLTFDDLFLSQEDSYAIIQAGDTTIRLKGVDVDDLSENDFIFD